MAKDDDEGLVGLDQLDPDENPPRDADIDDQDDEEIEPDQPDSGDEEGDEEREEPELAAGGRQEQQQPPSRRQARIQALRERTSKAERDLAEANRRIDELIRSRQPQPTRQEPSGETAAQREARRAQMSPEDRIAEDLRESERRMTQQMQSIQSTTWDSQDRALFEAKAATDPTYRKWAPRVETKFQELRQNGAPAPREAILKFMLGEALLNSRNSKGNQQRQQQAQRRVQANTTRAGNNRSDTQASRGRGGRSLEERLADTPL